MRILYSLDDEQYLYESIDEAVSHADVYGDEIITVYEGVLELKPASYYLSKYFHEQVLEDMSEMMYEETMDESVSWPMGALEGQKENLRSMLCEAIDKWATDEFMHPDIGSVKTTRVIRVRLLPRTHGEGFVIIPGDE